MSTFSTARAAFLFTVLVCAFGALAGRVAYLQTYGREQTIRRAERQQHQGQVLPSRRGGIFDANGILMAGTVQTQTCYIDPKFMLQAYQTDGRTLNDLDLDLTELAKALDVDAFDLAQLVGDRSDARFIKVAEKLDEPQCDAVRKLNVPGVGLIPDADRYYPMGSIAAHILGGVGKDGKGLEGLELKFDPTLGGKDGFIRVLKDARRRAIAVNAEDYLPPQHGKHLVLTVDANVQMIAEQELAATCQKYRAARGEVVVMDPRTGDVLAMANWPTFNPQNLGDSAADLRRNRCLTDPYEPGSTFKPFLVGPALSKRLTRVDEVFAINGPRWRTNYGRTITDVHGYASLSTWDVLVKSSNIGMAMLAQRMGNTRMYNAVTGFGFGRPTGVELPGEDGGVVHPLGKWSHFSTDSVAQGYEVMVTPVQLARAFCAYANGGRLVQPRVVKGVLAADGSVVAKASSADLKLLPQAIDPMTAADVKRVLCDVVIRGTAQKARSKTWTIFGKTGTAHISQGKAGYAADKYTSSFMGGAPAESPKLVVAFIIHEPDKAYAISQGFSHYGGAVAAPGASRLLDRALAYLQQPASPDLPLPPPNVAGTLYAYDAKVYANRKVGARE